MEVREAISKRFSVRSYLDKPVEKEKIERILEAGRLAPSAGNRQEWRYVVVTEQGARQKLMEAAKGQKFVGEAPVIIVACAETDNHMMSCGQICYPIDVAISVDHMTLQAVEDGLGTCWVGAFSESQVQEILDIPPEIRVVELLPLGYPAVKPGSKNRKSMDEIVRYEKW